MKMSVWSLACQQSVAYFSDITVKNIYQSFTHKMAVKASWHWNYVTVALCILHVGKHLYKHCINLNRTLFTFGVSISIRDLRQKKLFNSSSGSCHGSDVTWQEIGRACGSVYSIAALVPVHGMPSLLSDVHCFLNPSGTSVRLPIQDCWFWPVDWLRGCHGLHDISQSWFILFCSRWCIPNKTSRLYKHYVQPNFIYIWCFGLCQHALEAAAN